MKWYPRVTLEEVAAARGLASPRCEVCGSMDELCRDHIEPRDGTRERDRIGNLQVLCKPCNSSKGNRSMKEWLPWRCFGFAEDVVAEMDDYAVRRQLAYHISAKWVKDYVQRDIDYLLSGVRR